MGGTHCCAPDQKASLQESQITTDELGPVATSEQAPVAVVSPYQETPAAAGTAEGQVFTLKISKQTPDDKLGMDVKHVEGRLQVDKIFANGLIDRHNSTHPNDQLMLADILLKVNGIEGSDHAMVAECKSKMILEIEVLRRPH